MKIDKSTTLEISRFRAKVRAALILLSLFPVVVFSKIINSLFDINEYIVPFSMLFISTTISMYLGDTITKRKFHDKKE